MMRASDVSLTSVIISLWPLFFTVVYYLIFNGVLTLLFGRLEKRMARFSL